MTTVDDSLSALVILLSLVLGVALYVWTALALAAMFRKMGEQAWKGWVPVLNQATVLKWGGFSPWLVLLMLVPGVGMLAVWILMVIAAHRLNPGFGYGGGMTVLAALLFVVWASILGFGPARWLGARLAAPAPSNRPDPAPGPARTGALFAPPGQSGHDRAPVDTSSWVPPVEPAAPAVPPAAAPAASAPATPVAPISSVPVPPPAGRPAASPAVGHVNAQEYVPAPRITAQPPIPVEQTRTGAVPVADSAGAPAADATVSFAPVRRSGDAPVPPVAADESVDAWESEIDDVSAVSPAPFPPSGAAPGRYVGAPVDTSEPIAFVPGRKPAVPSRDDAPVTRMPATPPVPPTRRRTPVPAPSDDDAFPEMSGEVSAVVGSPAAGMPLSARRSVSSQQRRAESPADDERDDLDGLDDAVDQTVIARRNRPAWQIIPASGAPIALTSDVAILGRQPAPDPTRPRAQLIALDDRTRTVSKTHARLELKADGWHLTDLHSTNGVLLPTVLGTEIEIEPGSTVPAGDRFLLGDAELRLVRGDA